MSPTCLVLSSPLFAATSIIHLWPFQESFSIDFLYCFNKRLPIDCGTTMSQRNPLALIYQSTGKMSAWHMAQSISCADFNGFGFHFFIFKSSILKWWSAQSPKFQLFIYLFITDFSELSFTASGRCASNSEHSVRTQSRVPNNEHKWTPRPEERKQQRQRRERDKWTARECLRGWERQERCLHLLIHAESTCLCLGALGDVLKAAVMNAALSPVTGLISARLSPSAHCRQKPGRNS